MPKNLTLSAALIACAIFILLLAAPVYAVLVDKIVAIVDSELITEKDIDEALAPVYFQLKDQFTDPDELESKLKEQRQALVKQLIEERLILSEAKRQKIKSDEADLDARLSAVMAKFNSEEEFENALASQSISLDELRQRYRNQQLMRQLMDKVVRESVGMNPGEVSDYYQDHPEEFRMPDQVKLWNILIKIEGENQQAALDLANNLYSSLKKNADFSELAKEYSKGPNASNGGDMGFIARGQLLPEIDDIIFNLKKGEISQPHRSKIGYHIFMVEDTIPAHVRPFDEVKPYIEQKLYKDKAEAAIKTYIEKLKKHAYISIK